MSTTATPSTANDTDASATTAQTEAQKAEEAKRREAEEAERRKVADQQAQAQRSDLEQGGTGEFEGDAETAHSIADPKATPVDYAKETARRPAQRNLPPEAMSSDAAPHGPLVNLPYGSEPKGLDTETGKIIAGQAEETLDPDDGDADTDGGRSAAARASTPKPKGGRPKGSGKRS